MLSEIVLQTLLGALGSSSLAVPVVPQDSSGVAALVNDPRIQRLVDDVDASTIEAAIASLAALTTRRATSAGAIQAQGMIQGWLQGFGLVTSLQSFGSQYSRNVVAEIPGLVHPEQIVVIGAHYDSINGSGSSLPAPGADDNASGSAGVVESARILASGGPYESTLRFILFSGEEFGLLGSAYAAQTSQSLGESIVGMINLDMIAYRAAGDARDVDFATNNTTSSLVTTCRQLGSQYVPGWASTTGVLTAGTSDHQSYFTRGFPAVFLFEDLTQYCPALHTSADSYPAATNDLALARMIVQGAVATAATLAASTCPATTSYCAAAPNSTGFPAIAGSTGTASLLLNDLVFEAHGCPPNVYGLFLWGTGETQVPLGNGFRCVAASILRFPMVSTTSFGDASYPVDLVHLPNHAVVAAGDARHLQFWFRDGAAGGARTILSDALRLTICP